MSSFRPADRRPKNCEKHLSASLLVCVFLPGFITLDLVHVSQFTALHNEVNLAIVADCDQQLINAPHLVGRKPPEPQIGQQGGFSI